jgi:ABC-2 type transport system ATP-binding protein
MKGRRSPKLGTKVTPEAPKVSVEACLRTVSPASAGREASFMPAVVRLSALTKSYGRTVAVRELDLELERGKVVGFLGHNGAGKTTVLRVLTGMLRATSGRAEVLGLDPWRQAATLHYDVGYLPGDLRLPPDLTGRELLDVYERLRGFPAMLRKQVCERLEVPLDEPVRALSKGNRQKVGIAQAFMSAPRVLLLDEPTSGLDPYAQEVVDELMREAAARGALVLLSSHVLSEVDRVADQVAVLRHGSLVAFQGVAELRVAAPHRVVVRTADWWRPPASAQDVVVAGDSVSFTVPTRLLDEVVASLAGSHLLDLSVEAADLETFFVPAAPGDEDAA